MQTSSTEKKVKVNFDSLKILVNFLLIFMRDEPGCWCLSGSWWVCTTSSSIFGSHHRGIFSFNNSVLTKTGIQYQDSLRTSSPGRSVGVAGKGRRACNYVSGIWISISIESVDAKCWLAEMILVMMSLPLAPVFQRERPIDCLGFSHRGL